MTPPKIHLGKVPPCREPSVKSGKAPEEKFFTFSLRYWQEIKDFGIGDAESRWFASLLARLHDLCKEKVSRIIEDGSYQGALRYHVVDWDSRSTPISRDNLNWLPAAIRENEAEFPIVQFHVSKAVGRVHGFWDADWCFQIVLLDPMHNLQPSKHVGYAVRSTSLARCQYTALCTALDKARSKSCRDKGCELAQAVRTIAPEAVSGQHIVIAAITPDVANELQKLRAERNISISEVVEHGITFFEAPQNDSTSGPSSEPNGQDS